MMLSNPGVMRARTLPFLGFLFIGAGIAHFGRPGPYIGIVPRSFPDPALLVAVSGAAEIAGGIGLLVPWTRRAAGIGLILLLVAVFPANIYMLIAAIGAGKSDLWQLLLWLRLPIQPLLAWWIWRVAVRRQPAMASPAHHWNEG